MDEIRILESAPALAAVRAELWRRFLRPIGIALFAGLAWAALAGDLLRFLGGGTTAPTPWWGPVSTLGIWMILLTVSGGTFPILRSRWRIGSRGITIRGNRWASLRWRDVADWEIRYLPVPATAPVLSVARRRRWYQAQPTVFSIFLPAEFDHPALAARLARHVPPLTGTSRLLDATRLEPRALDCPSAPDERGVPPAF